MWFWRNLEEISEPFINIYKLVSLLVSQKETHQFSTDIRFLVMVHLQNCVEASENASLLVSLSL